MEYKVIAKASKGEYPFHKCSCRYYFKGLKCPYCKYYKEENKTIIDINRRKNE